MAGWFKVCSEIRRAHKTQKYFNCILVDFSELIFIPAHKNGGRLNPGFCLAAVG